MRACGVGGEGSRRGRAHRTIQRTCMWYTWWLRMQTARGTVIYPKCLKTPLASRSLSLCISGPTGRSWAVAFLKNMPFQAPLAPSPPRVRPRDFRGGLSVFSSHPDLVPPRCLFGKQALCPQPWWFILEFLPEHAQWPNRIALLAIPLLLWTSQFLPVCLVPLFTCPHDIPGQSPTALWTRCYHNLFISWSPFLSALATLPHTHASRDHHAHQALFSRTYRLLSCSRPPSSKSRRGF